MIKLKNTLYIVSEDSYLTLDGENVVILRGEETLARYPLHTLEAITAFTYRGASPALMGKCAEIGVNLSFLTPNGRFLARATGRSNGNVLLRRAQYRLADSEAESCRIARGFIIGKLYNCRWILERATRDHALSVDTPRLKTASSTLRELSQGAAECADLDSLRGLEGKGAAIYFSVFDELILKNKSIFSMRERTRRPPLDELNALLSFLYTLLSNTCASSLEAAGLDSYVGFMHRDRPGRTSLAQDLMEELRAPTAERLALTLINKGTITKKHFRREAGGGVFLNDDGRKIVITAWQERRREELTHPYLDEKIAWGLVPHAQAMLLARTIRGDIDEYPPFFWK